ncbi:MAG: hypothetical protein J5U19_06460 [Candidatus Methanoperedens sp.]|nr:hypothetical protein [Candidatus Methanoperedens sp.]
MMRNNINQDECRCGIPREEKEVVLNGIPVKAFVCPKCGYTIYSGELQTYFDKLRLKRDIKRDIITIKDWILAILFSQKNIPIKGAISLMKQLFLIEMEFSVDFKIPSESFHFFPYKYGPFSIEVDKTVGMLESQDIIKTVGRKSTNKELFYLTEEGRGLAEKAYNKLKPEEKLELQKLRKDWDQLGPKGILKLVYINYKPFTKKSEIKDKIIPIRKRA